MSIGNLDVVDTEEFNVIRVDWIFQSVEEIQKFLLKEWVQGTVLLGGSPHKKKRFNITVIYYIY